MVNVLTQVDALPEVHRAMREQFQMGGSILETVLALLGLASLVALAYALTALQRRRAERLVTCDDPQQLFGDVLDKLELSPTERRTLRTVVRDLRLDHPAVILLSETLFDRQVSKWLERRNLSRDSGGSARDAETISAARTRLFPVVRSPAAERCTSGETATPA